MKSVITTIALGTLILSASTVFADRGGLDTNGDGALSLEELQTARPGLTQERFASFDANGDGVLDKNEQPRGRKLKRSMDTNGDGSLDLAEVQVARPGMTAEKFAQLDVNNDGLLSRDERPQRRKRADKFAALDTDGSGGVSLAEMQAGKNGKLEERFARADLNGDGEISAEEHELNRQEKMNRRQDRRQERRERRGNAN
ncbi:MAG: hypothetical protein AB8G18_05355 [Gammaproteobacteria bacterium]